MFALKRLILNVMLVFLWVSPASAQVSTGLNVNAPKVVGVLISENASEARVEIISTRELQARVFTLSDQKPRVVVDFPTAIWMLNGNRTERGEVAGAGAILKYRYAQNSPTRSRIVFEVAGPVSIKTENDEKAGRARLILKVTSADPAVFAQRSGFPSPPAESAIATETDIPKSRRRIIILDAGHGGKDPGALAVNGAQEKSVTLGAARQLAQILEATGRYKVVLTRADDTFIPLERRVEIARTAKADLFLSLHADSGERTELRGASVYTLSEAGTERAKSIMSAQDWELDVKTAGKPREVADILVDLAQRDTKNQSAVFAQKLVPQLRAVGASVLENTHRNAGFYVLLAPDVPAVLLEMGFLTNQDDAAFLTNSKERGRLMSAVALAIDEYFVPAAPVQEARR